MDPEKVKRRQSLKIIISETIMVLTVIFTVIILALLVSGYWLNSDFKVERNGLLQISSIPTGADVSIDGESAWLQRTNTSKVLSSGEHTITLTKDNYDSWSKTISISEGLLYRLHYPRLFLQNRTTENVLSTPNITIATVSPDRNSILLIDNTTQWTLLSLDSNNIESKTLDISPFFSNTSLAENADKGLFTGQISDIKWDSDNTHILFKVDSTDDTSEWVLLNIKNISKSTNITKDFGYDFTDIQILDNSSNNLLVVQNSNLRKIDIPGKSLSSVLVENIIDFDHYNNEIIFSAISNNTKENKPYYIGSFKIDDDKINTLQDTSAPAKVTLSRFYDDMYITILESNQVSLYKKEKMELLQTFDLTFNPDTIKIGHDGEFITMTLDNRIATLDMESMIVNEWQTDGPNFGWIDNDMIYSISNGNLIVYDYDGFNRRTIAANVSSHFPTTIANKWLYYFSDDSLVREIITD